MKRANRQRSGFLESFHTLEKRTKDILADIEYPIELGLTILTLAQDHTDMEYLSLEHMEAALEAAGVAVKRVPLARAMARAGNRVSRKEIEGEPHYKIMTKGRREAEHLLKAGNLNLLYIEGNKPRTARRDLGEMLRDLSGTVRICDPYYGIRSLETLELFRTSCRVRFLTARTNETGTRLSGPIRDFKRERPNAEIRVYPNANDLHDRYILGREKLLIVGHGLKDIGSRESFVIAIQKQLVPDLFSQVKNSFDAKWAQARPL